ncbi:MAG: tRNA (adenosine(37)-N6)-threonylcarbamoyltransferase complex ATPase subunit type 1 TsaE [Candidatus Taylorbacteria bacterium]|nr:tRNA (adenosine(37)-N6)-threonylcarbamoyltransferase complex ATPase subunit type 1 TsaE [Candidatus Taylorbacteria bacterium]
MLTISHTVAETESLASFFISKLVARPPTAVATVLGLNGDLGSGKTAFTKGIAQALHVQELVTSPTFVIEKIYQLDNSRFANLIHIDAYRLDKGEDLVRLGWDAIIKDPKNLIIVEWPQNVKDIMPANTIDIVFTFVDPATRGIEIKEIQQ